MDFLQVIGTIKAWIEWWKSINQLPLISRKHITIPQWWMYILPITYLFSPWRPNHGVFVCGRKHENVEKEKRKLSTGLWITLWINSFWKQSTAVYLKISTQKFGWTFLNCKNSRCFFNLHDALMFFVGFFQEFSKEKINCTNNVHLNKN